LTDREDPVGVAVALRESFGLSQLSVAVLNGLQSKPVDVKIYEILSQAGFELTVDAGVRSVSEARRLIESGAKGIIVALETNPSGDLLDELLEEFGAERIVFSIDLKHGEPLGRLDGLPATDTGSLAVSLINRGCRRLIVLDLAAVGTESGPVTLDLCRSIREVSSETRLITGGGVRNGEDLKSLARAGVDDVMMATALHNSSFTPRQLARFREK
jgi:phosphoribosylformimino-5-aminoimidazole carboxamide ribotide isomerase